MRKQLLSLLALLLMAAGGAVAQNAHSVNARELTRTPSGTWMLNQMPGWSGQLEITLREAFRLDSIPLTWTVMVAGVDKTADVTAYTAEEGPDTLGWLNVLEGDTVELVPPTVVKPTVKNVTLTDNSAPAALPTAAVTTAPTATTGNIVAGTATALVSAGTAEGGTMMYKVTTENTQPTTTEGFSATVPTAASLSAMGTYYVWYYVQGDADHSDSEISASAVAVTVAPQYYNKLTQINDNYDDQVYLLKQLGRGRQAYNSSLTAAQAYALATYQAAIDGQAVYVIMSSQNDGYDIHYAVSTDASATEHTAYIYTICNESNPVRMYYVAQ